MPPILIDSSADSKGSIEPISPNPCLKTVVSPSGRTIQPFSPVDSTGRNHRSKLAIKRGNSEKPLPSLQERNRIFSQRPKTLTLSQIANLIKRGLTRLEIDGCLDQNWLWAEWKGYAIAAIDPQTNLIVGAQLARDDRNPKYWWLLSGQTHLPETDQNPLAVWISPDFDYSKACKVFICEGFLKSLIAAIKAWRLDPQVIFVGASGANFGDRALQRVLNSLGDCDSVKLCPDAGAVANKGIIDRYLKALELAQSWGYSTSIAWWEQTTKQDSDVDEIAPEILQSARSLTVAEIKAISQPFLSVPNISHPQKTDYEVEVERVQKKLNSLTYTPNTELNQRFLGELPLPAPGTIFVISSACKTGKTHSLKELIAKHRAAYPNAKVILITYRRTLAKQTAKRLGIINLQDLRGKGYRAIQNAREIIFVLDSNDKIDIDAIPPNSLIILDEGDALLKHGLEGGTLKGRQAEILSLFQKTLNKVLGDGGSVLLGEDDLTDLSIDTLKAITGNQYPVDLTVNRFQPSHWDVSIGDGSKAGVTKRMIDYLREGERVMLVTSAQKYGEEVALIVNQEFDGSKKVVRLDAKTVETLHSLVEDPNVWLKDAGIDLLICSPTAESGFNITIDVFDRVIGYFVSGETRTHIQLLERYRPDVPREIFCLKFSNFGDANGRSLLPSNVLKDWKLKFRQTAMVNQVEQSLQADIESEATLANRLERFKNPSEEQEVWNQAAANFKARANGASAAMLERLTNVLKDRGHNVTPTKWERDDRFKDLHKQARREIDLREANRFSNADAHGLALDEAHAILNSGTASQDDRLIAYKRVVQDDLPGAPLDDTDFVLKALIENFGQFRRQTEFLFLCQNSDVASFLDKKAFKSQLDKPFIMLGRFRHNRLKVDLMGGIFETLMMIARSENYRETDELVQAVKEWAVKNAFEIWRVLQAKITEDQTAIDIVSKLLRKLGYKPKTIKHERDGKKRIRVWKVIDVDCPHRQEILKALHLKWEKDFSNVGYTTLNTEEPLNKIVYHPVEIPLNSDPWAAWKTPDQRELIREWWKVAQSNPDQAQTIRANIPIEVLRWAIS